MTLHKLTAGDGYEYLTRQVAAADSTELGRQALADYYSEKGERPGMWLGRGLDGVKGVSEGEQVDAAQMKALFGAGRHPDADRIMQAAVRAGATADEALEATHRPPRVRAAAVRQEELAARHQVAVERQEVVARLAAGQREEPAVAARHRRRSRPVW